MKKMKISEDDIILFNKIVEKNKNAFVLKSKNGKSYLSCKSIQDLFEKAEFENEFEYLITIDKNINEENIKFIKAKVEKGFKLYLVKENKIIEAKI